MADSPAANGNGGGMPQGDVPTINALAQYTKDLSFENPNAPRSLQPKEGQGPQINIQVNVNAQQLSETDFEVELKLEGDAKIQNEVLFAFEVTYAGVFRLLNIPADQIHPAVMIECPRLLFPSPARSWPRRCATAASRRCTSTRSISSGSTGRR